MAETFKPRLWSDFDGTAVEIVGKTNWRNWSKYPLAAIPGYSDFLRGVQNGGVEIAGIVSRRPDIPPRRFVTARSIASLGMDQFLADRPEVVLAGSEAKKAQFLAKESRRGVVGMIDDKPHKFGAALIQSLLADSDNRAVASKQRMVLGAINHGRSREYVNQLAEDTVGIPGVTLYDGPSGLYIDSSSFSIKVMPLEPYSTEVGQAFANELIMETYPRIED